MRVRGAVLGNIGCTVLCSLSRRKGKEKQQTCIRIYVCGQEDQPLIEHLEVFGVFGLAWPCLAWTGRLGLGLLGSALLEPGPGQAKPIRAGPGQTRPSQAWPDNGRGWESGSAFFIIFFIFKFVLNRFGGQFYHIPF